MRTWRAIILALAVAACGQGGEGGPAAPPGDPADPYNLNIEIGRYGAMLSQVHDHTFQRPGVGTPEPTEPAELARALRETVWEYNLESSRLCAKGLFRDVACGPAYEPSWISEPIGAAPSFEDLQARSQAVGEQVMPLWSAVCESARLGVPEEERMAICPME